MSNINDDYTGTQSVSGASETSADASVSGATGANQTGTRSTDAPPDAGVQGTASGNASLGATDTSDQADALNEELLEEARNRS